MKLVESQQNPATGATAAARSQSAPARRPTICQVLHTLNVGGAEVLAARLARQLEAQFHFVFACLDELGTLGRELIDCGYHVEVLDRKPGFDLGCARRLSRFAQEQQADIIHAHQYTPFSYALSAGLFGRRPPVLFTEHGRWFPDFRRRKRIVFNWLMLRKRDRVIGVGQSVRQALINNEGIPSNRVNVIYNGVDLNAFRPESIDRRTIRRELGVGDEDLLIMQIARLDALKDHVTAIRTLERVLRERPDAKLVLVGEGPEQPKIEAETKARGLESAVRMVGLRTDVPRLLPAADVFLLTSVSEGIPLTLIEAMMADVPIVATRVGGVPEVVLPGETGLLAPAGDDAALAAAILQLAGNPLLRRRLSEAGRERARNMFSEQKNHEQYRDLYREMLRG